MANMPMAVKEYEPFTAGILRYIQTQKIHAENVKRSIAQKNMTFCVEPDINSFLFSTVTKEIKKILQHKMNVK